MTKEFEGRTAIVTGAGAGIGRPTAVQLAALGANVVVADLHSETAVAAVTDITSAGASAIAVVGDLSDRGSRRRLSQ